MAEAGTSQDSQELLSNDFESMLNVTMDGSDNHPSDSEDFAEENQQNAENRKSEKERRARLRDNYRNLMGRLQDGEVDSNAAQGDIDALFEKVEKPREMCYDSKAMEMFSAQQYQKVEKLKTNIVSFNPKEFATNLVEVLSPNEMDVDQEDEDEMQVIPKDTWVSFGRAIGHLLKKAPPFHYMFGSFQTDDLEIRPRKQRAVRSKEDDKNTQATQPKTVTAAALGTKESTTEEVERILGLLWKCYEKNNREPICFFHFAIDPGSYSHTIENIFHISFLIRDGRARLYYDEFGLPVLVPLSEEEVQVAKRKKDTKACIISMTMDEHEEIVRTLDIPPQPVIPARL